MVICIKYRIYNFQIYERMLKKLLSHFINTDKALEILQDNEKQIGKLSEKSPLLSKAVEAGFRFWYVRRIFFIIWWIGVVAFWFVIAYVAYWCVSTFLF